ncbi:MAG: pyruvate oxidase [Aerococcus sp.]|nr:pyruvate oxidase [Aerococcus sp.]
MSKINASDAMLKVIEAWGVKNIYGLPGGSFDSTMNAIYNRRDTLNYVQVRHEEVGALAAVGEAKVTGKIGVTFGSAGPGAVHLLNGLYDAQYDHVPVLALIGQVPTFNMNTHFFQELNENPMFEDVSVYNRTAMTAEQLPAMVDEAIREAYAKKGVAVITIPKDLGWTEIEDNYVSTAKWFQTPMPIQPNPESIEKAWDILKNAKHPLIYIGQGSRGAREELLTLAHMIKAPIMSSALGKGIVPDNAPEYMGASGRVATKPGVEAAQNTDAVLFLGSDMPFQGFFIPKDAKYIQVDIDGAKFGRRHSVDLAIQADAKATVEALIEIGEDLPETPWYRANLKNKANWMEWLNKRADIDSSPLAVEAVFKEINAMATDDAIFQTDVGNVTIDAFCLLDMSKNQQFSTSGWYATMGYGLPASIGAKAYYPDRQVWSISGDGGWAMVFPDVLTQVKYNQHVINVVLTNKSLGFIEAEQDDTKQPHSGVDLIGADFGAAASALGATGFDVDNVKDLKEAFQKAQEVDGPVVINANIANDRPLPVEQLKLDPAVAGEEAVKAFTETYQTDGLIPLTHFLKDEEN